MEIPDHLTYTSWETCMQAKRQQLEPGMEQWTGTRLGKEHVKTTYCYPAYLTYMQSSVWFSPSVVSNSATPWTAARQASLSITNSWSLLKLMSTESVRPSNHLILCCPFSSHLQSFPASGSFPMSQFFASGGQSIWVSASTSVLPMNIQDWFPLGWLGWISLLPKGLSRVFSNTTVQSINTLVLSFLYSPTLTSIHDYWKNHSFD